MGLCDDPFGFVLGAIGTLTGVAGVVLAFRANGLAKRADQAAQRANQLSEEANGISAQSNRIAIDANRLAQDANTISLRQEARSTERNDVRWDGDWPTPGRYVLTNRGQDEAFNVIATVSVDGDEIEARADRVPPGGSITFSFTAQAQQLARQANESQRRFAYIPSAFDNQVWVNERVQWETPLGQHCIHEPQGWLDDLGLDL